MMDSRMTERVPIQSCDYWFKVIEMLHLTI